MGHVSPIARRCERAVVTAYSELRRYGTDGHGGVRGLHHAVPHPSP